MKNIVLITQVGISIISPILLGLWIGSKLNDWLGTKYIFSIIMLILGIAAGFLQAYKLIIKATKDKKTKSNMDENIKKNKRHLYEINFDEEDKKGNANGR